jgi:hypothetical protein
MTIRSLRPSQRATALSAAALLALSVTAAHASAAAPARAPQSAGTLPRLPTQLNAPVRDLKVRPGSIIYTGDGSGILTGASVRKPGLKWSSWTTLRGLGTGYEQIDTCNPNCAQGRFVGYPVKLNAFRPGIVHGQRVFTRLSVTFTGARPKGISATYTFITVYDNGFGFGPVVG